MTALYSTTTARSLLGSQAAGPLAAAHVDARLLLELTALLHNRAKPSGLGQLSGIKE